MLRQHTPSLLTGEEFVADPITDADRQTLRDIHTTWTDRLLDEDYEGMLELYTDDTIFMPPNQPMIEGKDGLLSFMRAFPPVSSADFTLDEIDGYGDLAYACGSYSMTLEPEGAPGPVEDRGKFIEIHRRQEDGRWLLARDIFNSDLEPSDS